MKRYILTGAPGAGKTTIIRALQAMGHAVVEEAATDVIASRLAEGLAEPWMHPSFVDDIAELQRLRQIATPAPADGLQFFDRGPVCTYALSRFLGHPDSTGVSQELDRIERLKIYQRQVFFIDNLGFVTPTAARRISFEDSLRFEAVHEAAYRALGYELIRVLVDEPAKRAEMIARYVKDFS